MTVHASAEAITERLPAAVQVEAINEHTCTVAVGSDTPQLLAPYLGLLDADFRIDPSEVPELAEYLQRLFERYHHAA